MEDENARLRANEKILLYRLKKTKEQRKRENIQVLSDKNEQLQVISKSMQVFISDLKIEKQRVKLVLENQNVILGKMTKSMGKHKIRKENMSEKNILKAVVPEEHSTELSDGKTKEVDVVDNDDKDDSGREFDSSDQTSDDKSSSMNLLSSGSKTVMSYSYWTHYI